MLSKSYIQSRKIILRNWVMNNTSLRGNDIEILVNHIFNKYYKII